MSETFIVKDFSEWVEEERQVMKDKKDSTATRITELEAQLAKAQSKNYELIKLNGMRFDEKERLRESLQEAMRWIGSLTDWEGAGDPDVEKWRAAIKKATEGE